MARHALRLLLALAAGYGSALVATPVLRRRPRPARSTRHAVCCSEPLEAALEGWVASRRILGSAMAFIDVHASPDDVEQPAHRDMAQREVARPEPVQVLVPSITYGRRAPPLSRRLTPHSYTHASPEGCHRAGAAQGQRWCGRRARGASAPARQERPRCVLYLPYISATSPLHLDRSVYAVGARVRITGHWRARGGKAARSGEITSQPGGGQPAQSGGGNHGAAQSGESVTEWLLVAHTVRVLTAAPSVHGVRSPG
jgi:hypothetical protein